MRLFTAIMSLFKAGSPLAILRRIRTVVVNSFDSKSSWFWTHVIEKIFKLLPSATNLYSACAVIFIIRMVRTITSTTNAFPNMIQRSIRMVTSHTMSPANIPKSFSFCMTTGWRVSIFQSRCKNNNFLSAITTTKILSMIGTIVFGTGYHKKLTESFPSKINKSHISLYHKIPVMSIGGF